MNRDLEVLIGIGDIETMKVENHEITVINVDFDKIFLDKSIKLSRKTKKVLSSCGGGSVFHRVITYSLKKNKFSTTRHYIVRHIKNGNTNGTAKRFVLWHEIGHIVLGHNNYDCNDMRLEQEADKYAFNKLGIRKNAFLNSEIVNYALSSYYKKTLLGYRPYTDKEKEVMKKNLKHTMNKRFNLNVVEF